MSGPLDKVLIKIFAAGFYRAHAGILMVGLFVMFGVVEPGQLLNYHKTLMLALVSSPLMLLVIFAGWLLYVIKSWHYVLGQIAAVNQQFLFYSSNAFSQKQQLKAWSVVQFVIQLPVGVYGLMAVGVGFAHGYYLLPVIVFVYLLLLTVGSAWLYAFRIHKLLDGSGQSWLMKISGNWQKPWFSLFVYHVFDKQKITWLVTKGLSWLLITGFFLLFADVQHDVRVAGIALLAVATAHVRLVFEERVFEEKWLSFTRNLPYSRLQIFGGIVLAYLIIMFPETIWLFSRFSPLVALGLLATGISTVMLFHCLLYYIGLDMEKYMLRVFFLFVLIFWMILFKLIWIAALLTAGLAWLLFYKNYYEQQTLEGDDQK
ncbi:MAG TPA: hypothetical protein VHA56_10080 [Mucilaginibacter sp.]|nr:hypothetical protein [Mucilaginibacter sp.]